MSIFMRRCLSFSLALSVMAGTYASALNLNKYEDEVLDSYYEGSNNGDNERITITGSDGETYQYLLDINDNSVVTTSVEGNITTVMEEEIETGLGTVTTLEDGEVISQENFVDTNVEEAERERNYIKVVGFNNMLGFGTSTLDNVFSTSYTPIGSLTYKKNSSGVSYIVDVECKEISEYYDYNYDLYNARTKALQKLVTGLVTLWSPITSASISALASRAVDAMIENGVILVINGVVSSVSARYVHGTVTNYRLRFTNQFNHQSTDVGSVVYVKAPGASYYKVHYAGLYPQFLKKESTNCASAIYNNYDSYGFPGVKTWNATRTVAYAK